MPDTGFQEFAARLTRADLPEDVLATLRRSFADTMGVAAIGATTDMSRIARDVAPVLFATGATDPVAMLMDGRPVSPVGAAMAGAATIDSVDAHDGSSPNKGHAGSAIFPALLALAQTRPVDGAELAVLLALAYETSYRAGLALHATCDDYHTSGAWTAVGVAAMTARFLGGTPDQIRHAAGIGEYHGPRSQMMRCIDHPTMLRDGVGWGAASGVSAGYLAMAGFTGAPALTCEGTQAAAFWSGLGEAWNLVADTHYKPYPCCRWAHPALDGAQALVRAHGLTHDQIDRVEIRTFHNATRLAGHEPATPDEFAYAIAFPVAAMIVRGQVGVQELAPETLKDPEILRLSRNVVLIDDDEMTRISQGKRWAQVTLVLRNGERIEDRPRTPRGDADQPLSDAELSAKFHLFADPVLGRDRADEIEDLSRRFDSLDTERISRLLRLCTAPIP